jgi:two-component system response regulator FlrC
VEEILLVRRWSGNVRELANVLERGTILAGGGELRAEHIAPEPAAPASPPAPRSEPRTLDELERDAIARALAATGGNRKRTAEQLGIGLRTLYEKLRRFGLE